MVKLNKIYTRTGDAGDTGLVDGSRRAKYDLRVEAYGTVDEANSAIGVVRLCTAHGSRHDDMLSRIQHDLFDLGADLSTPYAGGEDKALRIIPAQVSRLEAEMDSLNEHIAPLNSFVLPGGSQASAHLHLARTVVRRAERLVCHLAVEEKTNPEAVKYLNRLSDFLFVLARAMNNNGVDDVLWVPGVNR
ncbi:MAG: cob(I)yrinic acid a,c-diamide adenosyltransferase [Alphaproteobacteria bacterium]|nr:cob(I)yrinic acid a,c-diamide adenosyltransferase [Alphaproteobacteria bacterium]